jgi:hypothetical protein
MHVLHRLALISLVVAAPLAAQKSPIGEGTWIVGGSASLVGSHQNGGTNTTSFSIAPLGLRFLAPRVAVGGNVLLGYSSNSFASGWSYGIGPSLRYYFGDPTGKTFPFVSGSVIGQWANSTLKHPATNQDPDVDSHVVLLDASVGITQMLATHVGLTGELFYDHRDAKSGTLITATVHDYGLRFGITAFVF